MATSPNVEATDPTLFDDADLLSLIETHGSRVDVLAGVFAGSALWRNTRNRYAIVAYRNGILVAVRRARATDKWTVEYWSNDADIAGATLIKRAITLHRRGAQNRTYVVDAGDVLRVAKLRDAVLAMSVGDQPT